MRWHHLDSAALRELDMQHYVLRISALCLLFGTCTNLHGQNIAVYWMGDGSASLSTAATSARVYLLDTVANNTLNIITIPSSGATQLTNSGSATSEGFISRSSNGLSLTFGGYDAVAGTANIANTTSGSVQRVVGQINADQTYSRIGTFGSSAFSGSNIRSAVNDGTNYWAAGTASATANAGVWYQNSPVQLSNAPTNLRVANIFSDQLYVSANTTGFIGISSVGNGLSTTSGNTTTLRIATGGSPYGFQASTSGNVVYVADDGSVGGIKKYVWNGSTWNLSYTLAVSSTTTARGLAVDWNNPAAPKLFATTSEAAPNRVQTITDTGAGSPFSTIVTADTNTAFRGIDLYLHPATWTSTSSGTQSFVLTNTSTSGFANTYRNWSNALADGNILSFQNVNSTGGALNINPDNNSATMTNVARIQFINGGFGTNTTNKTSYNLTGNALTLNGGGGAGADVINDSGVTQTITLNLGLNGSRTVQTSSGNLVMAGQLTGSGSLTKTGTALLNLTGGASYTGTTTVNGGTLAVNSTMASTAALAVNNTGTLSGIGTIASPVTINAGGKLAPGNNVGILSVNNTVTFTSTTSTYVVELNGGTTAGTDYDQLFVGSGGSLTLNNATLSAILSFTPVGTERVFLTNNDFAGAITGTFNGLAEGATVNLSTFSATIGYQGDFATNALTGGNDIVLFNFVAIPEPSTWALLVLVGAAAAQWYVRRQSKANRDQLNAGEHQTTFAGTTLQSASC
jgi:fibronectin-binding autotransporter adhesin